MKRRGYCIFIDSIFQGPVPSVTEIESTYLCNATERICVFATQLEAEREIADFMITRLQQFIDGERDFDDAVTVEEYVVEVDVLPDGKIVDANGNCFGYLLGDCVEETRSSDLVEDLVVFGKVEEAGLDEGLDGGLDEFRFGVVLESGLDFIRECFACGRAGLGGVFEFRPEMGESFFRRPQGGDFHERCVAGDEFLFAPEMADGGIEVGVFGDDVKIALGIGVDHAAEFESENQVQRVASFDLRLDDPQLPGMFLGEKEE
jgi:hypothetical protein